MTKIVYERLKVDEKKQIKAGTDQIPVSSTGCSVSTAGAAGDFPTNDEDSRRPTTIENQCLGIGTPGLN